MRYLFGPSELVTNIFKVVFLIFVVLGASMDLGAVVDLSDALLFIAAIPNVVGLYLLLPVVRRELDTYWADLKAGRLG